MDLNTSEFQFGPVKVHHRPPQKDVKKVPSSYGPENWISNNGIKGQEVALCSPLFCMQTKRQCKVVLLGKKGRSVGIYINTVVFVMWTYSDQLGQNNQTVFINW